jgi:hypothetical protein
VGLVHAHQVQQQAVIIVLAVRSALMVARLVKAGLLGELVQVEHVLVIQLVELLVLLLALNNFVEPDV